MDDVPLVVGLTGGIGSGKSTVGNLFAKRGADLIDTDKMAYELTQRDGAAMPAIGARFGLSYIDESGALDRASMRRLVFSDAAAKRRLEKILHPLIRVAADQQLAAATGPYAVLVVPLLIESDTYGHRVDRVLVVDCDEAAQVSRTMARSNLSESAVRAIIAAQVDRATRLAAADDTIDNSGNLDTLMPQVDRLHYLYMTLAGQAPQKVSD